MLLLKIRGARIVEFEGRLLFKRLPFSHLDLAYRRFRDGAQTWVLLNSRSALSKHLIETVANEAAIVVLGSCLLHLYAHRVQALLQDRLEVLLRQSHQPEIHQVLLDLPLDDTPERLDRVQLRAVRGQEHELEVEIPGQFRDVLGVMRRVVVEDHKDFLVGVREVLAKLAKELHHVLLTRGGGLHEDRPLQAGADGAEHGDACAAELGMRPLHCAVRGGPCACAPHPHVEGGLVEVDNRFLLLHQTGQVQGESHHRLLGTILRLLVAEPDDSVLDVVLHVKVTERVGLDADVQVLFQLYAALLEAHEAPALEYTGVQQVPADSGQDLTAPVVPAVEAPPVDQFAP